MAGVPVGATLPPSGGSDLAFESIAKAVSERKCILFLGAGVHAPPPEGSAFTYPAEVRPPTGAKLSETLASACDLTNRLPGESATNLQRVALCYETATDRKQLVDAVTAEVDTGKQPSPLLRGLAELGFPLVITTNYDQLFERALYAAGKQPRVEVYTPELEATRDYRDPTAESPVVFKIHGDILHPETIVITDEDYIQFVLRMSNKDPYDPIPLTLKYNLVDWTTLFVGYSLLDYNLRVLFKTLRWRMDPSVKPPMYAIDYHPDPLILDVWDNQRRYVKFIAQNAWLLVPRLYQRVLGKEMAP